MIKTFVKILKLIPLLLLAFFCFNAIQIYMYASKYVETQSDVAIVLGAGTLDGQLSPVFKERINHAIYLYNKEVINKVIFTGGVGHEQLVSDSRIALEYAKSKGVPLQDIYIEESSRYTIENLKESKQLMDSIQLNTALLVSDPLHMKRSMEMADKLGLNCQPSPSKTSMYRSTNSKLGLLVYETFFYSAGKFVRVN